MLERRVLARLLVVHAAAHIEHDEALREDALAASGEDRLGQRQHQRDQERGAQEEEQDLMPLDAAGQLVLRSAQPAQAAEGHRPHALGLEQMDDDRDGQQRSSGEGDGGEQGEHGLGARRKGEGQKDGVRKMGIGAGIFLTPFC